MNDCGKYKCPDCKERLVHQDSKGPDESTSGYGQYIHDNYGNTFYWMDGDGILFKKRNRMLRFIEHKEFRQQLRPSQETILPILATLIQMLVMVRVIHEQSGVFVVYSDPPYVDAITVRQIQPQWTLEFDAPITLDGVEKMHFETGEEINVNSPNVWAA